ncbi:LbetaH domain-containing protein [Cochlodiniinecator piscidefendens]|uniref:chloramphenicol acetyltransferase n=1 Tax=Cochlodiniinecator piscidefendens TaxID=2715756 RepID=UPI00140A836F|nr:chloramphenicol acetyltransferase [Cochlodiniinecator piscidefendens]
MTKLRANAPYLHADCAITESHLGRYVEIGQGSRITHSTLDDYSYCDRYSDIANTSVGKFSNIASFTRIGPTDHPMDKASLHHFLYRSEDYFENVENDQAFFEHRKSRRATIGHDTWIGHAAIVRPEVTIGHGAIVASNAVVTKDVAPYTIVAGIPAKPIRARFSHTITERLISFAWWDWPHDVLRIRLGDFRTLSIDAFLEKYESP